MIDRNREYTLKELLDIYNFYNLDFKYYGDHQRGDLELYLKTDTGKISVFRSINNQKTLDYLKLTEEEAEKVVFVFDRELDEEELDIVAIVVRTSDINIPSNKYKLETLDKLTKEQDIERRDNVNLGDGIAYMLVELNTTCHLYSNVYMFGQGEGGFINSLENRLKEESDSLSKNNLKMVLDYYHNLNEEKVL